MKKRYLVVGVCAAMLLQSMTVLAAPKQMSEDEIKATIQSVLDELGITEPTGKDRGKIMKDLMPKVKGKADGKLVNQMVASMLK